MDVSGPALADLPPGPRWPAVVQLGTWLARPFELLLHLRETHGTPLTLRFPKWPAIVLFDDPEAAYRACPLAP